MNNEEVELLCDLTEEQLKCFKELKRAYSKCVKSGIYFHQVLDTIHAFNGENVKEIDDNSDNGYCTQTIYVPFIHTVCSWADDNHYVHFKDD
jgi:hypothetical protein